MSSLHFQVKLWGTGLAAQFPLTSPSKSVLSVTWIVTSISSSQYLQYVVASPAPSCRPVRLPHCGQRTIVLSRMFSFCLFPWGISGASNKNEKARKDSKFSWARFLFARNHLKKCHVQPQRTFQRVFCVVSAPVGGPRSPKACIDDSIPIGSRRRVSTTRIGTSVLTMSIRFPSRIRNSEGI